MSLSSKLAHHIATQETSYQEVLTLLTKYKLLALLPSIKRSLEVYAKKQDLYGVVAIETPFPIDETSLASIKRLVGNDLAPHSITINKNLLAGFKARFRGFVYDGSAERIIKQFVNGR